MTISSTVRIAGPYIGSGAATAFPFAFKVFAAAEMQVAKLNTTSNVETILVLNTDYTVQLNGDQNGTPGGTITLPAVLASGFNLTITSDIANLQPTDLTNQGGFYPEVITDALDRATIQIQQLDQNSRAIKIPLSDGVLDMTTPVVSARQGKYLAFDSFGLPVVSSGTGSDSALRTDLANATAVSAGSRLSGFRQAGTGATARTVDAKLKETVSVKDFGAVGDGVTDDTAAIQAAVTAVGIDGGCVLIPTGTYKITSAINIPQVVAIKGQCAERSIIRPYGCNGINFVISNGIGPIAIEDIFIYGSGCQTFSAIIAVGNSTTASRVTGLNINRVRVSDFKYAINWRGVWHGTIRNCSFNNCIFGILLKGQCVKISVENNTIIHNLLGTVTPAACGLTVESTFDYDPIPTEHRPEDIQLEENLIYGFPIAVSLNNGLFISINNNDLDGVTLTGIQFAALGGTLNITKNWIGLVGGATSVGIYAVPLGVVTAITKNISENEINSISTSNYGINIQANQHDVRILNNTITNFTYDIFCQNNGGALITGNRCNTVGGTGSIYIYNSFTPNTVVIENNTCLGYVYCHPSANTAQIFIGANQGLASTKILGKSTILAATTTVTTTYASLNSVPPNFGSLVNTGMLQKLFIQTPLVNIGSIFGTADASQVIINCSVAPVANTIIYWEVRSVATITP